MHNLTLTDEELQVLKVISDYATTNDAYVFVADQLITDDDQGQQLIRQLNHRIQNLK